MQEKIVMFCIFSKESIKTMNGIRGKMTAQSGHAFLHSYWDAEARFPELANAYKNTESYKICLITETNENLLQLYRNYKDETGVTVVIDSGKTVFHNEPTLTCVGIGPILTTNVGSDLESLELFK